MAKRHTGTQGQQGTDPAADAPSEVEGVPPEEELHRALWGASSWTEVVRLLHRELGLTKAEIARAAGVDPVTVGRWVDAPDDADVRARSGLDDLRFVVLSLLRHGRMRKKLLRFWLTSRDVELGTDALTAIAQGRFDEVVEAGMAVSAIRKPVPPPGVLPRDGARADEQPGRALPPTRRASLLDA